MCGRDPEGIIPAARPWRLGPAAAARARDGLGCIDRHSGDGSAGGLLHFYPFKLLRTVILPAACRLDLDISIALEIILDSPPTFR